jgi:D-ribose pyranose/furanose isomerase RbsD
MKPEVKLTLEILRNEMRVTEARLSDELDHEKQLRIMHGHAYDRAQALKAFKADLIARSEAIMKENETP